MKLPISCRACSAYFPDEAVRVERQIPVGDKPALYCDVVICRRCGYVHLFTSLGGEQAPR